MTIKEFKKKKIQTFIKTQKIENPTDNRLTFISNEENIRFEKIQANKIWFIGDADEILNYYTGVTTYLYHENLIYNRNNREMFWALSSTECHIKRIHSGLPKAIIDTITNVTDYPKIEAEGWESIEDSNSFDIKLTQQARPMTLAEGYGAFKVNYNLELSDNPIIEFYDAEKCDYIVESGMLIGIMFTTFVKHNDQDFCVIETRYKAHGNSYIDYEAFLIKGKNDEVYPVDIKETGLDFENQVIEGLNEILAVPNVYFYDPLNPCYGKSIYSGKIDLFDHIDELWSQLSHTARVSTPVVWYNPDILGETENGVPKKPNLYNRDLVMKAGIPDGEGHINTDIVTDQPRLDFDKYILAINDAVSNTLIGILSPASMGIDVARKDNAEAQREKEKATMVTRSNLIASERKTLKKLVNLCLIMKEYFTSGKITNLDYDVKITYNEFASPTVENQIELLGTAWSNGEISTKHYVDLLWGDKLTEEEKLKEIEWLDEHRTQENSMLDLGDDYEEGNGSIPDDEGQIQVDNVRPQEEVNKDTL